LPDIANYHAEKLSSTAEKEIFEASKNFIIYYKHTTPIVYTKVKEFGVQLTIGYLCNPRQRRSSENGMWEDVILRFKSQSDIQFAYPTTRFYNMGEENLNP